MTELREESTRVITRECPNCTNRFNIKRSQCPSCHAWDFSFLHTSCLAAEDEGIAIPLSDIESAEVSRIATGPWDDCFGGGIVRTSSNLIGGAPGAGKSTFALQISNHMNKEVIYLASEETGDQIKLRADRLLLQNQPKIRVVNGMGISDPFLLIRKIATLDFDFLVVDSLQGLCGFDKLAEAVLIARSLKEIIAVDTNRPVFIIDHITKADDFAGLMALQHEVDALFTFKVDERSGIREFATVKNRFGASHLRCHFDMTDTGLVMREEGE